MLDRILSYGPFYKILEKDTWTSIEPDDVTFDLPIALSYGQSPKACSCKPIPQQQQKGGHRKSPGTIEPGWTGKK